jgi:hypothetical protein
MPDKIISMSRNCCFSLVVSSLGLLVGVALNCSHDKGCWLWIDEFIVAFAFIVIGMAAWLMVRLGEARRALRQATGTGL